jgi:hypothetical protein
MHVRYHRLPTIKELYTLIDFKGVTGSDETSNTPYIDSGYFNANYGKILFDVAMFVKFLRRIFSNIICFLPLIIRN